MTRENSLAVGAAPPPGYSEKEKEKLRLDTHPEGQVTGTTMTGGSVVTSPVAATPIKAAEKA